MKKMNIRGGKAIKQQKKVQSKILAGDKIEARIASAMDAPIERDLNNLFQQLSKSEAKFDAGSIDKKLMLMLEEKGYAEGYEKIKNLSNSSESKATSPFNLLQFLIATMVLLLMLTTGVSIYLWPELDGAITPPPVSIAPNSPALQSPSALLRPTKLTDSGYVASDSAFEIVSNMDEIELYERIRITPAVEYDISTVESAGELVAEIIPRGALSMGTKYTILIVDGDSEENKEWVFPVEPKLEFLSVSPDSGSINLPLDTKFTFEFNHKGLIESEIKEHIRIIPEIPFEVEVVGNFVSVIPTQLLTPDIAYELTIMPQFGNRDGSKLDREQYANFSTRRDEVDEGVALRWSDFSSELVSNGNINAEAVITTNATVRYELYEIDSDITPEQISAYTLLTANSSIQPINSETLPIGQQYSYKAEETGRYLLVASDGQDRIGKKVTVTEMMIHLRESGDTIYGWIFSSKSGEPLVGVEVIGAGSTLGGETLITREDGSFQASAQEKTLFFVWNDDTLSIRAPFTDVPASIATVEDEELGAYLNFFTDKPEYKMGDEFQYAIQIPVAYQGMVDVIPGDSLQVEIYGFKDGVQMQIQSVDLRLDNSMRSFSKVTLPTDGLSGKIHYEISHMDRKLESGEILLSEIKNPASIKVSSSKESLLLGESVRFSINTPTTSSKNPSARLRIYRSSLDELLLQEGFYDKGVSWRNGTRLVDEVISLNSNGSTEYLYTPFVQDDGSNKHIYTIIVEPLNVPKPARGSATFYVNESPVEYQILNGKSNYKIDEDVELTLKSTQITGGSKAPEHMVKAPLRLLQSSDVKGEVTLNNLGVSGFYELSSTQESQKVIYKNLGSGTYFIMIEGFKGTELIGPLFTVGAGESSSAQDSGKLLLQTVSIDKKTVKVKSVATPDSRVEDGVIYLLSAPSTYAVASAKELTLPVNINRGVVCTSIPLVQSTGTSWSSECHRFGAEVRGVADERVEGGGGAVAE